MDTLAVRASPLTDCRFEVRWRWHKNNTPQPIGGILNVEVPGSHVEDAAALAELRALFYLLEERKVHGNGANRLGSGITIEQSFGAVKKALAKKALKTSGVGKTEKRHIAAATEFLATKFFGAKIVVEPRDKQSQFKQFESIPVELMQTFPRVRLNYEGFDGGIAVSRHALHRQVGRVDQGRITSLENDLSDVPDARFEAAWGWFAKILSGDKLEEMFARPDAKARRDRYTGSRYLHFPSSTVPAVLVITPEAQGWVLATVLRREQTGFLNWPPIAAGAQLRRDRFR